MREMVLLLIAFAPPQQMLFGTTDVIFGDRPIQSLSGWLAAPSRITSGTISTALANGSIG